MWFNVEKAREHLFRYGFVYSLRPKKGRGRKCSHCGGEGFTVGIPSHKILCSFCEGTGRILEGKDVLMFDGRGKKGMVYFWFVKEIPELKVYELHEFLVDSGFGCVMEWLGHASFGFNRFLYLVVLLDCCDFCGRDDFSPEEMYSERQCLECRQKELEGLTMFKKIPEYRAVEDIELSKKLGL